MERNADVPGVKDSTRALSWVSIGKPFSGVEIVEHPIVKGCLRVEFRNESGDVAYRVILTPGDAIRLGERICAVAKAIIRTGQAKDGRQVEAEG